MSESEYPGSYMFYFRHADKQYCIDGTYDRGTDGFGRLLNHSRNKTLFNVKPVKITDNNNQPHIVFFSSKDINAGEELLFDYGDRDTDSLQQNPWLLQ